MQRFVQGFLPVSFTNVWITNRVRRQGQAQIELRDDDNMFIPFVHLKSLTLHPLIFFPKIWEQFPDESIKFIRDIPEFNFKLKQYFLEKLNSNIICTRLFCPSCNNIS